MNQTKPAPLRRFMPYLLRYKGILLFDLVCAALTCVCELVLPLMVRAVTNMGAENPAGLTVAFILRMGALYGALRLVDAAANYFMANTGHVMGARIETDMRRDAFAHLQKLSDAYFANTKVGQIMGRITNDLFDVTEFAHHCPEEFFIAALKVGISFVILAQSNLILTCIVFALIPLMAVCCAFFNHKMRSVFQKQRRQIGELNARIEDTLLGERVVKAFSGEEVEKEKFERDNSKFLNIKRETYHWMSAFNTTTRLFDGLIYLVVLVAGSFFMRSGGIQPGDLVAYMMYVTTLLTTVRRIIEFAEQFYRGLTGVERFCEIMDADVDILDEPGAQPLQNVRGDICFENVSFEYPDDHNQVLHRIHLHVKAGERIALVGPSGGGKTTLCNLIPRFYEIDSGAITIDGMDIRDMTRYSLRRNIGIVQQDVFLFNGTIRENIAYGDLDATDEQIIEAAKKANIHDYVMTLEEGYDTNVGERGVKLSGGQKQRISIARVFLKNPSILILDEATSALDNATEMLIQQSLSELAKGRTCIIVAHRLSTIKNADEIIVLTKDGIEERGTHDELMKLNKMYAGLYMYQFKE